MKNEYVDSFYQARTYPTYTVLFKPLKYRHVQHLLLHLMIVIGMILPPINFYKTPASVSTHTHTDTHTHICSACVCVWSERSDQCAMVKVLHVIVNYTISKIRSLLDQASTEKLVHTFTKSRLDYCNSVLYGSLD